MLIRDTGFMVVLMCAAVTSARADETAKPLQGPYPSYAAFCGPPVQLRRSGEVLECRAAQRADIAGRLVLAKPPSPIVEARIMLGPSGAPCTLGLRTTAGWFVADHVSPCRPPYPKDPGVVRFSTEKMAGLEVIWLTIHHRESGDAVPEGKDAAGERFRIISQQVEHTVLCAVGSSGKPSCFGPLHTRWTRTLQRELIKGGKTQLIGKAEQESGARTLSLGPAGLMLGGEAEKAGLLDPRGPAGLPPGTYRIVFP